MHIAAAVDTPVIALFGPSGAFHWGPWNNRFKGQGSRVQGQEKPYPKQKWCTMHGKAYRNTKDWDCIPCGKDGCEGSKISDCLLDISVGEVIDIIGKYLRN